MRTLFYFIPLSITQTSCSIAAGQTITLKTNKKVTWTSSKHKYAIVDDGVVIGLKKGTSIITATCEETGESVSCKVTVKKSPFTIKVGSSSKNYAEVEIGSTLTLAPAGSGKFTYSSSAKKTASVSKAGVISGKKLGYATVTIKNGKKTAYFTVKVTTAKITVDKTSIKLKVGKTYTLSPKQNVKKAKFTYESSDPTIATVDKKGKITAKSKGSCTITITSSKGETLKVKVT